jgi:hypothetical protein
MHTYIKMIRDTFSGTRVKIQKLLATTATVLLTTVGAAHAATVAVTDTYTITESGFTGAYHPSITNDLVGSLSLTPGTTTTATNFFVASPSGSCGTASSCNSPNFTQSGTLTVQMHFTETVSGATGTLSSQTGTYIAKYSGSYLPCSGKSGTGSHQSDCIDWTGASSSLPSGFITDAVHMSNGDTLNVTFYNAQDWAITPTISFDLLSGGGGANPTPIPAALPLFATGLGAFGLLGWRRKRKAKAA